MIFGAKNTELPYPLLPRYCRLPRTLYLLTVEQPFFSQFDLFTFVKWVLVKIINKVLLSVAVFQCYMVVYNKR